MKNVKIKPYPNYKITEECITRDIKPNTQVIETATVKEKKKILNFDTSKFVIAKFDDENRVFRFGPAISSRGKDYLSVFPNPVHLFLDSAINAYNTSEKIKTENFVACGKKGKTMASITLLDIEKDGTHECYNEFLKQRMTSIAMLTASVEAFLNYSIPNTYTYVTAAGESYNKERIENMRFKEKLKDVLPLSLSRPNFWDGKENMKGTIIELYSIRTSIIHLKTNAGQDFEAYFDEINKMSKLDLKKSIETIIDFMNYTEVGFIDQK